MVTRREVLALAGSAPALLGGNTGNRRAEAEPGTEQHEFVQSISSFEKTKSGVVFPLRNKPAQRASMSL